MIAVDNTWPQFRYRYRYLTWPVVSWSCLWRATWARCGAWRSASGSRTSSPVARTSRSSAGTSSTTRYGPRSERVWWSSGAGRSGRGIVMFSLQTHVFFCWSLDSDRLKWSYKYPRKWFMFSNNFCFTHVTYSWNQVHFSFHINLKLLWIGSS